MHIDTSERRARLAIRHHLAPVARAASVDSVARDLVCLHATDPASVYLSVWARMTDPTISAVEKALYEDRSLVRMLAMRRTMFVVPAEDTSLFHSAASLAIARTERPRTEGLVAMLGVPDPAAWLRDAEAATLAALADRDEAAAQELSKVVPALREQVLVNAGKKYEGKIGLSSRVLLQLGLEGEVIRGRPRGTWISSQYRWALTTDWLGRRLEARPEAESRAEVIRRWLARFGPGTEADLRWWTGWTAGSVRAALAAIGAVKVDLDGTDAGFVLPGDVEPTPAPEPWVALLPCLDPTTLGWKSRGWYLGGHGGQLFDSNGNAGPTIWADSRIVGGWAITFSGRVVTKLLEDIGTDASRLVEAEAGRLEKWLATTTVVPRFAPPLHRELISEGRQT